MFSVHLCRQDGVVLHSTEGNSIRHAPEDCLGDTDIDLKRVHARYMFLW